MAKQHKLSLLIQDAVSMTNKCRLLTGLHTALKVGREFSKLKREGRLATNDGETLTAGQEQGGAIHRNDRYPPTKHEVATPEARGERSSNHIR